VSIASLRNALLCVLHLKLNETSFQGRLLSRLRTSLLHGLSSSACSISVQRVLPLNHQSWPPDLSFILLSVLAAKDATGALVADHHLVHEYLHIRRASGYKLGNIAHLTAIVRACVKRFEIFATGHSRITEVPAQLSAPSGPGPAFAPCHRYKY
jgi:hypothetical protein